MVRAGEESGSLEIVLKRLADFLQSQIEMRAKIMATLAYPVLMLLVGVTVVFFLVTCRYVCRIDYDTIDSHLSQGPANPETTETYLVYHMVSSFRIVFFQKFFQFLRIWIH